MLQKLLVIDDDQTVITFVHARLEAHGYRVIVALNGEEGLQQAKETKPDLIILDVQMPSMDGYTFVQEIKKSDDLRDTPIIILTAKDKLEDLFKAEGIKDYLVKPVDIKILLDKIQSRIGPTKKQSKK